MSRSPDKGWKISKLPNEILDNIIVSIISNVAPVQLEHLVKTAKYERISHELLIRLYGADILC